MQRGDYSMEEILILGGIAALGLALLSFWLFRMMVQPLKLEQIKKKIDAGQYESAINDLEDYIKKDEKNPLAHLYLADCYYATGKYDLALVEYKQVVLIGKFSKQTTEKYVRSRIADIYLKMGQIEEAQKEFLLLSKIVPNDYYVHFMIGKLFYERNMRENAIAYLIKATKLNPKHAESWYYLGLIYFELKKNAEALEAFARCVSVDPKNYEAHYYLGYIYKIMNNYSKAMQELEIAERAADNELKMKVIYLKGLINYELGYTDKAISEFQRALKYLTEENNTTIAIRYALASAYEQKRNLVDAVEQWEQIAKYRPNYLDVQEKLAKYADLRLDDRLKDFLTASASTFEIMAQNVIRNLGHDVIESKIKDDNIVEILAVERTGKWGVRQGKVYAIVTRQSDAVDEDLLSHIVEKVKTIHAVKGICVTASKFTPKAIRYAENRPIVLVDRSQLSKLLKQSP